MGVLLFFVVLVIALVLFALFWTSSRSSPPDDAEGSNESRTSQRKDIGPWTPWTLWLVSLLAVVLGGVLWWAIGGTAAFDRYTWGPAHWLQQGCDSGATDGLYAIAALGLIGTGIRLVVKAVRRGDYIGLLAGLILTVDGLLMFWYFTLMANTRGCD